MSESKPRGEPAHGERVGFTAQNGLPLGSGSCFGETWHGGSQDRSGLTDISSQRRDAMARSDLIIEQLIQ